MKCDIAAAREQLLHKCLTWVIAVLPKTGIEPVTREFSIHAQAGLDDIACLGDV